MSTELKLERGRFGASFCIRAWSVVPANRSSNGNGGSFTPAGAEPDVAHFYGELASVAERFAEVDAEAKARKADSTAMAPPGNNRPWPRVIAGKGPLC